MAFRSGMIGPQVGGHGVIVAFLRRPLLRVPREKTGLVFVAVLTTLMIW